MCLHKSEKYDQYKTPYDKQAEGEIPLVKCEYFQTNKININHKLERDLSSTDSFVIFVVLEGNGDIHFKDGKVSYQKGDCILIPAILDSIVITPSNRSKMLETFIPD